MQHSPDEGIKDNLCTPSAKAAPPSHMPRHASSPRGRGNP